jgi:2-polyprenyl-3-methyl-5-hydroxy-6-metoxy-1,4-benzoquinol methylase
MTDRPLCQGCGAALARTWVDLGLSPLANSNVPAEAADRADPVYPLHAYVCDRCLLVQVPPVVAAEEIFNGHYAYFSSYSESWLRHCEAYAAAMVTRFGLGPSSQVVEIASNDGYLLQYFAARAISVLGVEPSRNTAEAAIAKGIPTEISFFGAKTAKDLVARGHAADLLAAKNVMAHVPDINDFVAGIAIMLKPEGVFTVEFPHLLNTIRYVQFDTIYHEHYTYLSLLAVGTIFARAGLRIFDVEEQPTHGGSLRLFACREDARHAVTWNVERVRAEERAAGLDRPEGYAGFEARVTRVRRELNAFLDRARAEGRRVAGYGAAAKGNTLINYCGIGPDRLAMIADRSAAKQGLLAPGSHIPIVAPDALLDARPDYVLILPWNLADEIKEQLKQIRAWGGRFVTAVPALEVD